MTDLKKTVSRRTVAPYSNARRRLVVALMPGDVIAIREERRRKWYVAPVGRVYQQVMEWNLAQERAQRRAARKAKKG